MGRRPSTAIPSMTAPSTKTTLGCEVLAYATAAALFPDDGKRHELIDGEHYLTPSPNLRCQAISGRLYLLIGTWLRDHPTGQIYFAPLDVIFSRFDVVEPDLLYVSHERAAEILGEYVTGAPDLVIEIGSPSTRRRDATIKRSLYERSGVAEYWVVDPEIDVIRVYRRSGERFDRPIEPSADAGDVLTTGLLPGLEILSREFSRTDRPPRTRAKLLTQHQPDQIPGTCARPAARAAQAAAHRLTSA